MTRLFLLALLVFALAGLYIGVDSWHSVHAAPAEPVPECKEVSKTPNLSIYLCEPDGAPPFLINSYGFMVVVE